MKLLHLGKCESGCGILGQLWWAKDKLLCRECWRAWFGIRSAA